MPASASPTQLGSAPSLPPAPPRPPPVDLTGWRSAYEFVPNRVHALVHYDGRLTIPTGGPEFMKFVEGGWKTSWILGEKDAGKPIAHVSGLSSSFFVPIDADGDGTGGQSLADLTMTLEMRALAPRQRISVFANEKAIASFDVAEEWNSYDVTVPASALALGENRFRLTYRAAGPLAGGKRSAAAVRRISIGPRSDTVPPDEGSLVGDVAFGGMRQRAFSTSGPSRLSFYVQVPKGGRFTAHYASASPETTVLVRVARDGSPPVTVFEGRAAGQWAQGAWDLGAHSEQVVRVDLVARGGGIAWGAPRLLVQAPQSAPLVKRKFDRIYVWMVDTLRADKVRVYNPKTVVETPNYDAFAADATRFAWAHVPGTWSLPSHASIFTGVYPSVHRAIAHESKLSREIPFVAEALKKAGYRTALFSSNGYISAKWGFDRGWDETRNFIRESLPNGADYLWKTAKTWIIANLPKPQFVYLATVEPHVIYNPKKEFLAKYWTKPYHGPIKPVQTGIQLGHIKTGKLKLNETDKAYLEALHNAEITQSDTAFGAFLADLRTAGVYDSSVVVVVSDHGDEFWEHGDVGHAQSVHQELVRVPLMIRAPGQFPAGKVVDADVEAMDLCPTLLELGGVTPPDHIQGTSLISLAHDEVGVSPRAALSQNLGVSRGIKAGRYRFIHGGLGRLELYDEFDDPREQDNVLTKRPIALRKMRNVFGLLVAFENRWKKARWGTAANLSEPFYDDAGR